jgi:hypothetical protein
MTAQPRLSRHAANDLPSRGGRLAEAGWGFLPFVFGVDDADGRREQVPAALQRYTGAMAPTTPPEPGYPHLQRRPMTSAQATSATAPQTAPPVAAGQPVRQPSQ